MFTAVNKLHGDGLDVQFIEGNRLEHVHLGPLHVQAEEVDAGPVHRLHERVQREALHGDRVDLEMMRFGPLLLFFAFENSAHVDRLVKLHLKHDCVTKLNVIGLGFPPRPGHTKDHHKMVQTDSVKRPLQFYITRQVH